MHRIYLDFASATPVDPRAARAVYYALEDAYGNPSAAHAEGRKAAELLSRSRATIAESFSVKPEELVFTSGGTESNNIAIQGLVRALHARGVSYKKMHAVTSSVEHSSVLEAFKTLEAAGVRVTYVNPPFDGVLTPDAIIDALTPETVLVSLAHVNSETGVTLPLSDIARAVQRYRERGLSPLKKEIPECAFPVLHADAAQSPLYLESSPHALRAELVSYDAQKVMGPKGVGVLYRDFSVPLAPVSGGGTQERGLRPGTENVPGIAGAAVAFKLAKEERHTRVQRMTELRDYLIREVAQSVPEARLIGHPRRRVANNALFSVSGVDGDYLAVLMDAEGVSVTPRSACTGSSAGHSHVVLSLTGDMELARGTVRFSLGPGVGEAEINMAVRALRASLAVARRAPGKSS